jgi:hypothetical protein
MSDINRGADSRGRGEWRIGGVGKVGLACELRVTRAASDVARKRSAEVGFPSLRCDEECLVTRKIALALARTVVRDFVNKGTYTAVAKVAAHRHGPHRRVRYLRHRQCLPRCSAKIESQFQ